MAAGMLGGTGPTGDAAAAESQGAHASSHMCPGSHARGERTSASKSLSSFSFPATF